MRIVLTGGGTGGHLYPLVAVAEKIKQKLGPEVEFLYMGSGAEMEKKIMAEEGITAKHVLSGKMRRYFSLMNLVDVFKLPLGFIQSLAILLWYMPDAIFSKGGYVAVPVVLAAWCYRIPVMMHESDSIPGISNQFLAKFASRIAVAYPSAEQYFPKEKTALVGNPIRHQVTEGNAKMLRQELNFTESKKIILVLGGSQGSEIINDAILHILPKLLFSYQIIHQTGEKNYKRVLEEAALQGIKVGREGYAVFGFMNANKLRDAFALCDLVVSRAGATFITEIAANGKPSILIPLDGSANEHQRMNAYEIAQVGGALVLEETNLGEHMLGQKIDDILSNNELMEGMSREIKKFYHAEAAEIIANGTIELARK